jgi:hypothetical protein
MACRTVTPWLILSRPFGKSEQSAIFDEASVKSRAVQHVQKDEFQALILYEHIMVDPNVSRLWFTGLRCSQLFRCHRAARCDQDPNGETNEMLHVALLPLMA